MNADAFHDHLDACKRCREQPFNLCPAGLLLLRSAAANLRVPAPSEHGGGDAGQAPGKAAP